jgi:hypothetical protein
LVRILLDEEESSPVLGFQESADSIVEIIKGSTPNFSIGVYGEWEINPSRGEETSAIVH